MADRLDMDTVLSGACPTNFFRPESKQDRPLPPPMATTLRSVDEGLLPTCLIYKENLSKLLSGGKGARNFHQNVK
jgi:hypothetical protein